MSFDGVRGRVVDGGGKEGFLADLPCKGLAAFGSGNGWRCSK